MAEWSVELTALGAVLVSSVRMAAPMVLVALGGVLSERSGVINIALEGLMLIGSFAAAAATYGTGSPVCGVLAGAGAGALFAAIYALCVLEWKADQIVAGMAINLLTFGLTPYLCKILFGNTGSTPSIHLVHSSFWTWAPLAMAVVFTVVVQLWLKKTAGGLWLRVAGDHPASLESVGVSVRAVRWKALLSAGALAGVGGAILGVFLASAFSRNMTAGRGFMALAAMIFGNWRPVPAAFACLFFGLVDAIQIRLQGVPIWDGQLIPVQFIQILPYIVTMVALAGFMGRAHAPRALGRVLGVALVLIAGTGALILTGCHGASTPPLATKNGEELSSRSPSLANALLGEMFLVLYHVDVRRPEFSSGAGSPAGPAQETKWVGPEFAGWANVLEQGASLEGVYRGIVNDQRFQARCQRSTKAVENLTIESLGEVLRALGTTGAASEYPGNPAELLDRGRAGAAQALSEWMASRIETWSTERTAQSVALSAWFERFAQFAAPRIAASEVSRGRKGQPAGAFQSWAERPGVTRDQVFWEVALRIHLILDP